jgi:uncharacterized protein (TIGR03382 family)
MDLLVYLLVLVVVGLLVGALARLALPGRDPMSLVQTAGLGIVGSLIAGLAVRVITGGQAGAGILLSVLVTTGLVYLIRRRRGGTLTDPGSGPGSGMRR